MPRVVGMASWAGTLGPIVMGEKSSKGRNISAGIFSDGPC